MNSSEHNFCLKSKICQYDVGLSIPGKVHVNGNRIRFLKLFSWMVLLCQYASVSTLCMFSRRQEIGHSRKWPEQDTGFTRLTDSSVTKNMSTEFRPTPIFLNQPKCVTVWHCISDGWEQILRLCLYSYITNTHWKNGMGTVGIHSWQKLLALQHKSELKL